MMTIYSIRKLSTGFAIAAFTARKPMVSRPHICNKEKVLFLAGLRHAVIKKFLIIPNLFLLLSVLALMQRQMHALF